ncbi:hypothetical protein AB6A40_010078 [Gnathostoma spinigerum]|uniref:Globin domain-containing protein n=1 Tax=Gnathostoma spinigerum TaxID=75299 RepID=A0ABD6ETS0_9BILA
MRSHSHENRPSLIQRGLSFTIDRTPTPPSGSSLRQSTSPQFEIRGDLTGQQINIIKRTWKQHLKSVNDNEYEMASRLLIRIFRLEPRLMSAFGLYNISVSACRSSEIFDEHVKILEPTLAFVMSHLHDATALSKRLQMLGGRHVHHTAVTYKSIYWKIVVQAMIEFVNADRAMSDVHDAWIALGGFCVEQMRIGYKIEYKLKTLVDDLADKC